MPAESLEKIIVVHPHKKFDGALKCKPYIDRSIQKSTGAADDTLVLQGVRHDEDGEPTTEKLEIYIGEGLQYRTSESELGEISPEDLCGFVVDNMNLQLLGGFVSDCHQIAFTSVVSYIQDNDIHNVTVVVPFDGAYFEHVWIEDSFKIGTGRFDGIMIGLNGYEMHGSASHLVREVVTKTFGEVSGGHMKYRGQVKDGSGSPLQATPETLRRNIEEYFFKGYFTLMDEKRFNREYHVEITNDSVNIHIS